MVRPSTSEFCSPIVLTKKKDGTDRFCIDFRALNKATIKRKFPMPVIEEVLTALSGQKYFSVLDLASGYYQIRMEEGSKRYTAFTTDEESFEFNRMPFGLVNAQAHFQACMNSVKAELLRGDAEVYLDDTIIASRTVGEGLEKLERFLKALKKFGLTLNVSKCIFFRTNITFLGYQIDEVGLRPSQGKTEAIMRFPTPRNLHEVRQFLGLTGFFRKFVRNYLHTAVSLTELLKEERGFVWESPQEEAFRQLKKTLRNPPVLAIYNPECQHEVHTDASAVGIAGILFQRAKDDSLL